MELPDATARVYQFGPFSLDVDRRVMLKADQVVPLTSKAFDTLLALVRNRSRVVVKEELLKLIWPDAVVEERNLAVNISTLRKALGESPDAHEYIVTVPGRGYRFVAPLREPAGHTIGANSVLAEVPGDVVESLGGRRASPGRGKWRQRLLPVAIAAALAATFSIGRYTSTKPARAAMRFSSITNFAGVEAQPAFSPDGRSVAFVSDRGGQYDVYVALVAGGSPVRVTNDLNVEARPRWSPDGSKLVYARLNESGLWDIWEVPALGGLTRRLVSEAADPVWSPDGRSIAYANLATGNLSICDSSGHSPHALTNPEGQATHRQPAFSRDGSSIAFVRRMRAGGPNGELTVIGVGTAQTRSLTEDSAYVGSPAWSPDGRFIYFASGRGGTTNIWKVSARGGSLEQITVGPGDDADLDVAIDGHRIVFSTHRTNINLQEIALTEDSTPAGRWLTADSTHSEVAPAWSPDGKQIAYFTNRRGAENEGIWVMDADGANPIQLVQDERLNIYPRWSADSRSLIYVSRPTGPGTSGRWSRPEVRRVFLSGGAPQPVPFPVSEPFGDVSLQDQLIYRGLDGSVQTFELRTNQIRTVKDVRGSSPRWSADGRQFAVISTAKYQGDAAAGLWVSDLDGKRHQVFRGWVSFYSWTRDELLVLEGKPDLKAVLWRVPLDGRPKVKLGSSRLVYSYWHIALVTRFDPHPDGRRIVAEGVELHEADINMIDNIR